MSDAIRSLWLVIRLAFRADPVRAVLVLLPVQALGLGAVEWTTREVVDGALSADRSRLVRAIVITGVAGLVWILMALTRFMMDMRLREKVGLELDDRLIRTVADIPTTTHLDEPEIADQLELLRTHRGEILGGVSALSSVIGTVANLAVASVLLMTVAPSAVLLPLAGIPLVFLARRAAAIQERVATETAEQQREALHLFDLATTPDAAAEIRVFGLGEHLYDEYHQAAADLDRRRAAADIRAGLLIGAGGFCLALGLGAVLWSIAVRAADGSISPGDLVLVLSLLSHFAWQLRFIAMLGGWLVTVAVTAGRLRSIEAHAREVEAAAPWHTRPLEPPATLQDGIRFESVSFAYPGAEQPTLRDVDLDLPAGSVVAVVGDNGAGKSTLISLLCGLRVPSAGTIWIDDVDLARIPPPQWRGRISAGFQDHANYELIAHETVGIGDVDTLGDLDRATSALARASASDVIGAMDHGLQTPLGSTLDGADLSGGQWQKLAIGRAMNAQVPLLLLLDEPTSALDAETEHRLFKGYAEAAADSADAVGAITVVVSHRFSTVRTADRIVVVDDGRVCETGSHDELIRLGGLYAELYELQAAAYR